MLRHKLLTAVAATALLTAPAAFAQTPPTEQTPVPAPTPDPVQPATPAPIQAVTPATPATPAMPATPAAPAAQAATAPAPIQANNVIDVLRAQGNFTTLLTALDQAQLTDTLRARPAVSIFAPTDEAFAAMPEAERTRLLDPTNAQELRNLLLYHVIVADVNSGQIKGAKGGVETASRTQVLLDGTGDAIKIDGATVTRADIDASNGAVFAIDRVLNPAQSMAAMGDEETAAPAPAEETAPAESTPPATEATPAPAPAPAPVSAPTPAPGATTAVPPGATATTTPAAPGTNAPTGQPAATTTTIAAPPVPNPTDGQVDAQPDPSRTTPPVQTPDPADGDEDGTEPPAEPNA